MRVATTVDLAVIGTALVDGQLRPAVVAVADGRVVAIGSPGTSVDAAEVVRLGLVIVPEPSVKTVLSTEMGPAAAGVTALEAAEGGPVPMALVAVTVKV